MCDNRSNMISFVLLQDDLNGMTDEELSKVLASLVGKLSTRENKISGIKALRAKLQWLQ